MPRQKGSKNRDYGSSKEGLISLSASGGNFRAVVSKKISGEVKYISLGIKELKSNIPEAIALINSIEAEIVKDLKNKILDRSFEKYKVSKILDKSKIKPVQYYLNNLENQYFGSKKKRTNQTETTFSSVMGTLKHIFRGMEDFDLNIELMKKVINTTEFGTFLRQDRVVHLRILCNNFAELKEMIALNKFNFSDYAGDYEPETRIIPNDESIIDGFFKIGIDLTTAGRGESYAWLYGILATYGLRPHELLAIDLEKSFNPPYYEIYLDYKLCDGIKTGSRVVPPIPKEWVEEFGLAAVKSSPERMDTLTKVLQGKKPRGGCGNLTDSLDAKFLAKKIGFQPYDLRHAYAIRGYYHGFSINQMAKYMGHSVTMHERIYQKYLPDDQKLKDYQNTLDNFKHQQKLRQGKLSYEDLETQLNKATLELELTKDNLAKCQERNQELEKEVAALKAIKKVLDAWEHKGDSSTT